MEGTIFAMFNEAAQKSNIQCQSPTKLGLCGTERLMAWPQARLQS